jgi:hypothetical protein
VLPSGTGYSFQGYFVNPIYDSQPPPGALGYAGGSLVITSKSDGSNEVIWALVSKDTSSDGNNKESSETERTPGVLYAYDNYANGLGKLWDSSSTVSFCASSFALPTVVNWSVYLPTDALGSTCPVASLSTGNSGCGQEPL